MAWVWLGMRTGSLVDLVDFVRPQASRVSTRFGVIASVAHQQRIGNEARQLTESANFGALTNS